MILGEKVILTGLTRESIPKVLNWVNSPDMMFLTGTIYPISELEHEDWALKKAKSHLDKLFLIQEKGTEKEIGTIGMKNTDFINSNAEIYITLGEEEFRNSGYGTDALKALVNFCFSRLNLHKLYLRVFNFNKRAIRSYEKVGFVTEGILKEHHFTNGKYHDVLCMGIINNNNEETP